MNLRDMASAVANTLKIPIPSSNALDILYGSKQCPSCKTQNPMVKLLDKNGKEFSAVDEVTHLFTQIIMNPLPWEREVNNIIIECDNCKNKWKLYENIEVPFNYSRIDIMGYNEEELGREVRHFANNSDASMTQKLVFTRQFTMSMQRTHEERTTSKLGVTIGEDKLWSYTVGIEDTVANSFSIKKDVQETRTGETSVTVPPKGDIHVTLIWKNRWCNANVVYRNAANDEFVVPVKVLEGLTYDIEVS